jgi:hypothetical protein
LPPAVFETAIPAIDKAPETDQIIAELLKKEERAYGEKSIILLN